MNYFNGTNGISFLYGGGCHKEIIDLNQVENDNDLENCWVYRLNDDNENEGMTLHGEISEDGLFTTENIFIKVTDFCGGQEYIITDITIINN